MEKLNKLAMQASQAVKETLKQPQPQGTQQHPQGMDSSIIMKLREKKTAADIQALKTEPFTLEKQTLDVNGGTHYLIVIYERSNIVKVLDCNDLTDVIKDRLMQYGAFVKIQRATASLKGKPASLKIKVMMETADLLEKGLWKAKATRKTAVNIAKFVMEQLQDGKSQEDILKMLNA